jgi:UDP-N-acetylmuramate: L-alanyl-gamma-D-glutamyl-meso-diaminopimelate ligase
MKIHFIAIGGSAMHNLAIALKKKGHKVSGSDDEIFEPSRSRLAAYGLLPERSGWDETKITEDLNVVIIGMHARPDNPELLRAKNLGVRIVSYPEFLYEQTRNKIRVVMGGSHGKTTITSMIMHVLKENNLKFDFMVGAHVEGFETMVELHPDTEIAVFEGDEYLSSPIDPRPKFHLYKPHIGLVSGIAWDHINVFPSYQKYVEQFRIFTRLVEPGGTLIYFSGDPELKRIVREVTHCRVLSYSTHPYTISGKKTLLLTNQGNIPLQIFGEHNLQNVAGAKTVCHTLGISDPNFYSAIATFKGAARRLQILSENNHSTVFFDFAHSPSKLKATLQAVKKQFPGRSLVACMELHTYSSLKKEFLPQYKGCMDAADHAYVYFNPRTVEHKKLEPLTAKQIIKAFGKKGLKVFTDSGDLVKELKNISWKNKNLLMMSSGNFNGKNLHALSNHMLYPERHPI